MMEAEAVPVCNTCGEHVGAKANGDLFVGCHECSFPICRNCFEFEIKDGRKACMQCNAPFDENLLDEADAKVASNRTTMESQLTNPQDVGIHARHISSVSTLDSEMNEETANPIWKNRVESWKEKKNKKKKKLDSKPEKGAQPPPEQLMDDNKPSEDAGQALSVVIPIPKAKLAPYRTVIILRLIILGLFFHYRVTHPVESALPLWLTSVICEIWFAFSWVLDQFPKWSPINRDTFIDQLSARFGTLIPIMLVSVDKFILASALFLGLFLAIIATSILELRWSGVSIEELWRNEQFWVIGGVSAHLFAVFQGFLKMLAGIDTNFTVTAKAAEDAEFGELYIVKWTTLLIPPTTLLIVNLVGVVAGFSDALNRGYESWGPLFGKVFFAFWVILHLYPFLKGLMGRQNRTPTIVVLWSVLLASVFSLVWVKIDPFVSHSNTTAVTGNCISIDC